MNPQPTAPRFDFEQIAVPFAMRPGLRRLGAGARHLTPLQPDGALWHERYATWRAGATRQVAPGFDPAIAEQAVAERARQEAVDAALQAGMPLEIAFCQDFALLDGADGTLSWLCVCTPSHWAPEEKIGLNFAAVHAPVADNTLLIGAAAQLIALVTGGGQWERFVWTVSPSGRYDQHPHRQVRVPWPDDDGRDDAFAAQCWLRWERQTFFPVTGHPRMALFTIRVMLEPLTQAIDSADKARRLHDALASMTQAVLAYKSLTTARAPLLRWLRGRMEVLTTGH